MAQTAPTETSPLLQPNREDGERNEQPPGEALSADTSDPERRTRRAYRVVLASIVLGVLVVVLYIAGAIAMFEKPYDLYVSPYRVADAVNFIALAAVAGTIASIISWARRRASGFLFNSNAVLFVVDAVAVGTLWVNLPVAIDAASRWGSYSSGCRSDSPNNHDIAECERYSRFLFAVFITYIAVGFVFSIVQATIVVLRLIAAYNYRPSRHGDSHGLRFPSFNFSVEVNIKFKRDEGDETRRAITSPADETDATHRE